MNRTKYYFKSLTLQVTKCLQPHLAKSFKSNSPIYVHWAISTVLVATKLIQLFQQVKFHNFIFVQLQISSTSNYFNFKFLQLQISSTSDFFSFKFLHFQIPSTSSFFNCKFLQYQIPSA